MYEFLVSPYFWVIISASFISGASTPLGMNFVFLLYVDLKYVLLFLDNTIISSAYLTALRSALFKMKDANPPHLPLCQSSPWIVTTIL